MSQFSQEPSFEISSQSFLPDGAQPFDPAWRENLEEESISDESLSEPAPEIHTAQDISDIVFTNTGEVRTILATLTHYTDGRLGSHLKRFKGLIMLPLEAITIVRTPASNHYQPYPCIVFVPHQQLSNYQFTLPNLIEGINVLYNKPNP